MYQSEIFVAVENNKVSNLSDLESQIKVTQNITRLEFLLERKWNKETKKISSTKIKVMLCEEEIFYQI